MVKIISDSVCDMKYDEAELFDIDILPLKITFNDIEYKDGVDINANKLFKLMKGNSHYPKTSQISPGIFMEKFNKYIKEGNDVVVLTMTSDLSGTYQSALLARENCDNKEKVFVIDSKNVTMGQYAILKYMIKLRDKGLEGREIYEKSKLAVEHVKGFACLDTLECLVRNGRITKTAGFVSDVMNFKPLVRVENGLVKIAGKERGFRKASKRIVESLRNETLKSGQSVILGYCEIISFLDPLIDVCKELNLPYDILEVGAVTASNTGEGAIAYFLVEEH